MLIDGKNTYKLSFHESVGHGMKHHRLKLVIFCSNDNPDLTLWKGQILQVRLLYGKI